MNDNVLVIKLRTLLSESSLDVDMSDELLKCFLRARKNDLKRTMNLIRNYLNMTRNYPDLLMNLTQSDLQRILDLRYHIVSPRRDPKGCRVFIVRSTDWDIQHCTLQEVFRSLIFCFQMMASEEETQRRGIILVMDFKDIGLHQIRHFTPALIKIAADLVNDVFPLRFQGIHIVYEPWVFKMLLSMIWPFLSAKIRKRIFFHGQSMTSLHEQVDPACLPSDYEGRLGPAAKMHFATVLSDKDRANLFHSFY